MTHLRLNLSYLGTDFHGFQSQNNLRTVENELKKALLKIGFSFENFVAAGRTDSGVHANHQVVSLTIQNKTTCLKKISKSLNGVLPKDISILRIDKMPICFNAKNHAIGKEYIYKIYQSISFSPFIQNQALHIRKNLNIYNMQEAANFLIGEHDFESFRSVHCTAKHARRFIWSINILNNEPNIYINIKGNAFCQNMVRIISGTLIEVGLNKKTPLDVLNILKSKDRKKAGQTAKAHGLFLNKIYYPDDLLGANIPKDAQFPRYPISKTSWPYENSHIELGPTLL